MVTGTYLEARRFLHQSTGLKSLVEVIEDLRGRVNAKCFSFPAQCEIHQPRTLQFLTCDTSQVNQGSGQLRYRFLGVDVPNTLPLDDEVSRLLDGTIVQGFDLLYDERIS